MNIFHILKLYPQYLLYPLSKLHRGLRFIGKKKKTTKNEKEREKASERLKKIKGRGREMKINSTSTVPSNIYNALKNVIKCIREKIQNTNFTEKFFCSSTEEKV